MRRLKLTKFQSRRFSERHKGNKDKIKRIAGAVRFFLLFFVSFWVLIALGGEEGCDVAMHITLGELVCIVKIPKAQIYECTSVCHGSDCQRYVAGVGCVMLLEPLLHRAG